MADYILVKIGEMTEAMTVTDATDFFEILQGGSNRKLRLSTLRNAIGVTPEQKTKIDQLPTSENLIADLANKVDKVAGKGLSANDYTTIEKNKLAALPTNTDLGTALSGKVDKESGKGLSSNDYTTLEKQKLAALQTGADISTALDSKVDKVLGKGLSSNDFDDNTKAKLAALPTDAELTNTLNTKVDKEAGKVLSSNDYTTVDKNKLAALPTNTELGNSLSGKVDKVTGKELSSNDYTTADKTKLTDLPTAADLTTSLSNKVDKEAGKVLSSNDYTTTEKNKLGALPTNAALNTSLGNKVDKEAGKGLSSNDYTTVEKNKLAELPTNSELQNSLNSKLNSSDIGTESNQVPVNGMLGSLAFMEQLGITYLVDFQPSLAPGATWKQKNGNGFDEFMVNPSGVQVDITGTKRENHTGTQAISTVTGLQTVLDSKAPIASPTFTGSPVVPNLKFQNTTSADSFTLDYYEEGNWTPTIGVTTPGDLNVSYATRLGRYTRIGNVCTCEFRLVFTPTYTTAAGDIRVEGLPFTSLTLSGINYVGFVFCGSVKLPNQSYVVTASIGSNISRVGLITASEHVQPVALKIEEAMPSGTAGIDLRCTITYKVA